MNALLAAKLSPFFDDIRYIGAGMTSRVYQAVDRKTGTAVAIKVLNPHLNTDKISLERFKREIQITRSIQHPSVISIYDLAVRTPPYFLVMEYIDGHSLKEYIRLNDPLPVQTVVSILGQLLHALSHCHAKNVIHRDLKPQNIMVTGDGSIKILDFGIARMTALKDLTQTGTSLGSPEYMAPELFASNAYEPRCDLYAVGVIAFELLTGEIPFQGDTIAVLFNKHLNDPVPPLSRYRQDVPRWLEEMIGKLLAKKPYLRYQSANDAGTDLQAKRVMANAVPVLKKRRCFACGEETPADTLVCFTCGEDGAGLRRKGSLFIGIDSQQDPEKLREFFRECFGREVQCNGKRRTILIWGVDGVFAETFKKAAQRYGIHVTTQETLIVNLLRGAVLLLAVPVALFMVTLLSRILIMAIVTGGSAGQVVGTVVIVLGVVMGALRLKDVSLTWFKKPVLARGDLEESALLGMVWFNRLAPHLKRRRTDAMQDLVSQTLERFLLFQKHAGRPGNAAMGQMRSLLEDMLPVANYLSTMQPAQQNDRLARLMREHAARVRNNQDAAELEDAIRREFDDDEDYAVLVNRFTRALALFNRLMGLAIVSEQKIEEPRLEAVAGSVAELRSEVEVWKRVKGELAEDTGRAA